MADPNTCEYKSCKCTTTTGEAIRSEGHTYCSQRCADGRGCDHEHCNCGNWPEPEPEV